MNRRAKISAICSRFQSFRFKKGVGSCSWRKLVMSWKIECSIWYTKWHRDRFLTGTKQKSSLLSTRNRYCLKWGCIWSVKTPKHDPFFRMCDFSIALKLGSCWSDQLILEWRKRPDQRKTWSQKLETLNLEPWILPTVTANSFEP